MVTAVLVFDRAGWPCGLCHEDNRAAVYSYEAMEKVKANPDKLEFVVVKIKGPLPQQNIEHLIQWLSERVGVDPPTVKISSLQKSIGFVFEKAHSKEKLIADLSKDFTDLIFQILRY